MRTPKISLAIAATCALMATMFIGASPAQAADCLFTNDDGDAAWANAANWSCGRVPLPSDSVTIDQEVHLATNQPAAGLTLQGDAMVMTDPSNEDPVSLLVKGPVEWTGGSIDRLNVEYQGGAGTSLVISGSDPKSIVNDGRLQARGSGTVTIAEGVTLDISGDGPQWSFHATSRVTMETDVVISGEGSFFAEDLTVQGESRAEDVARFAIGTLRLPPDAVFLLSGGAMEVSPNTLITGTTAQGGGRIITGVMPPGAEGGEPTEVSCNSAAGCSVSLGSATWEHAYGDITGPPMRMVGTGESMPFVWSGGAVTTTMNISASASMEVTTQRGGTIRDARLSVDGEVTIIGGSSLFLMDDGEIRVSATGVVRHDSGSEVSGLGASSQSVRNDGTWITQDGEDYDPLLRNVTVSGAGVWDLTDRGMFVDGLSSLDIGILKVAVWSPIALQASGITVRLRKLIVTTSALPAQVDQPIRLVTAGELVTTGMLIERTGTKPGFSYNVTTTSTDLTVTLVPAITATLNCQGGCPTSVRVNQKFPITWLVNVPSGSTTGTVLTINWPTGVVLVGYPPSGCTRTGRKITCDLGTVTGTKVVPLSFRSSSRGTKTISALLKANEIFDDPDKASKTLKLNVSR